MIDNKLEKFLFLTNPLTWIFMIVYFLWFLGSKFLDLTGLYDWYFVLFKMNKQSSKHKKMILKVYQNKQTKFFWLKRKAWGYASKKIEKQKLS